MDRLIWTAWRAFWVGLGASAVLIAQSLLAPAPGASTVPSGDPQLAPFTEPARPSSNDPLLSRRPFDSTHGKVLARIRNAS
jgi:hypothetical protein